MAHREVEEHVSSSILTCESCCYPSEREFRKSPLVGMISSLSNETQPRGKNGILKKRTSIPTLETKRTVVGSNDNRHGARKSRYRYWYVATGAARRSTNQNLRSAVGEDPLSFEDLKMQGFQIPSDVRDGWRVR